MRLDEFDYPLADESIATVPAEPRDAARLLVDRGSQPPSHLRVRDLPGELREGDLLVVNDTRVIPARLMVRRASGGAVEVLLLEPLDADQRVWECLVRPARKLREGEDLHHGDEVVARVGPRRDDTATIEIVGDDPMATIVRIGETPLPPYLAGATAPPERYQTVYARTPGSAAAPTAGLHLTEELLAAIEAMGVGLARVELVVGLDTFRPVTAEDPRAHTIHTERYTVAPEVLDRCRAARRVVAVGTTSVRALESAASTGRLAGRTGLFIHRPYEWQVVDLLMTNFHMPRTTLLMMIDAFVGPRWRSLYETARLEGYRFLSFGDAMLLDRRAA
ncbi:MAG: tRNA preQ1(34) S-adenosylmethionine ribosyltransferase-isomerase QueA [Ilumatobacteraceae bacterium]